MTWSYLKRLVNASSSCLSCERIDFKCSFIWSMLCSKTLSRSLLTFWRRAAGARARRRGPGRGPGCVGMARAVGEEELRIGIVSSNPGRGGKFFFRVEASRRQWMGCGCFVVFGPGGFFGSKKKAIDRVRLGLKNSLKNIVDWFFTWMTQFFIHVKVASGLCHGFFYLDDNSFLPLEFCVSGKKNSTWRRSLLGKKFFLLLVSPRYR